MEKIFWFVFENLINLLQGFLTAYFVCGCLRPKGCFKRKVIPYCICSLLIFIYLTISNYFSYYEGAAIFINALIIFIFSYFALEGSISKKIFISIVPVNGMAVCSIFSTNLISFIVQKPIYEFLSQGTFLRIITVILANLILFLILFAVKKIMSRTTFVLKNEEWLLLSFNLVLSVIAYMFLYYSIYATESLLANFYSALTAVVIIVINITMYYLLAKFSNRYTIQMENSLLKQQAEYQEKKILDIKEKHEELQKIRHDFDNMIGVIKCLNKDGKRDEIDEYINQHFSSQTISAPIIKVGNIFIEAIVNTKISKAHSQNIDVSVISIGDLSYENNIDLCNLLGNLFDNAIRASSSSAEKKIKLEIKKVQDQTTICMKNTIDSSVLKVNPILSSDKKDKKGHGYGTKIIKEIAEKYDGFADFYEEDGYFCCNVVLNI